MGVVLTPWDTSTNKDVFKTLIKDTFDSTAREAVIESPKLFTMEDSDDLYERTQRMASMPAASAVAEAGRIPIYSPKYGQTKDYTQAEYGLGFRVSWMMKKTNKYDLVKKWTKSLSLRQKELKDIELAKLWNSPTATYTGYDSQVLGYASHTCLDDASSTFSNYNGNGFSISQIEAAELYFDTLKDDQGTTFFIDTKGLVLYFHPALKPYVYETFRSSGKPHEFTNTKNIWEDHFDLHPYRRLTSTTAWGVCAVKHDLYDVRCFTLAEPDVLTQDATDNSRDTIVTSHQAFSWGFGDARMAYIGNV